MAGDRRDRYLEPTQDSGKAFVTRGISGTVVMLNLLRFRAVADYSAAPKLASPTPISGAAAYRLYAEHTLPHLEKSGGAMTFLGKSWGFLVGPTDERWDAAMLVRHRSVKAFMAFATDEGYLAGLGHRSAALEDSRLLPLVEAEMAEAFA
jgi:hypothetical protein